MKNQPFSFDLVTNHKGKLVSVELVSNVEQYYYYKGKTIIKTKKGIFFINGVQTTFITIQQVRNHIDKEII